MTSVLDLFSIGHSTHSIERFAALLDHAGVDAIADVRSSPYSRYQPHFARDQLQDWLKASGRAYVFLGKELGGRPDHPGLYRDGLADYEAMARTEPFSVGIGRLLEGSRRHRIAIMCSEQEPLDCHRCLLVARRLAERGVRVGHVMPDARVITHPEMEERLLRMEDQSAADLFASRDDRLVLAYRSRSRKAAYVEASLIASAS